VHRLLANNVVRAVQLAVAVKVNEWKYPVEMALLRLFGQCAAKMLIENVRRLEAKLFEL
jgi:hypothetical protein